MAKLSNKVNGEHTPRDVRKIVRVLFPACTSPMRHARDARKSGAVTKCAHKVGIRVA